MGRELASIDDVADALARERYVADRGLATTIFLALRLGKPLFLEGEAGVGKTEVAKVLAAALDRRLVRLQCYEGLDLASAVYEWDYARQILEIRLGRRVVSRATLIGGLVMVWMGASALVAYLHVWF